VEIYDVFADEVNDSAFLFLPDVVRGKIFPITVVSRTGNVSDWGVEPYVKVFILFIRDLETKIGTVAAYTPVIKAAMDPG